jgi:hypothetical protein
MIWPCSSGSAWPPPSPTPPSWPWLPLKRSVPTMRVSSQRLEKHATILLASSESQPVRSPFVGWVWGVLFSWAEADGVFDSMAHCSYPMCPSCGGEDRDLTLISRSSRTADGQAAQAESSTVTLEKYQCKCGTTFTHVQQANSLQPPPGPVAP